MASHYTRSRARRPDTPAAEGSDVEPADVAPIAATSSTADIFVDQVLRPQESPGSMSTELVSAPTQSSLAGLFPSQGGPGVLGSVASPRVGVSLGFPAV